MLVPFKEIWRSSTQVGPNITESKRAAQMLTPGAATSGFRVKELVGPREEKGATTRFLSTAATVMALRAAPGDSMVWAPEPALPADTTAVTPARDALSTARLMGSSALPAPPRLKLMTSRRSPASPS